jgi:hypothetical protein
MNAFSSVKTNYKKNDVSSLSTAELQSLGDIVCGASATDISLIAPTAFCGAMVDVGSVELCEAPQLQAWASLLKSASCLGPNVVSWKPSDIKSLGAVIGGLTKDDLSQLNENQIASISESAIPFIPPMQFNGFSATQLSYLSVTQAAVITPSQYKSLDSSKQSVIASILSTVAGDLMNNPLADLNTGNGGRQRTTSSTAIMIVMCLMLLSI